MKKFIHLFFLGVFITNCVSSQDTKTITTQELKTKLNNEKIQLLDVRTPEEVALGMIENNADVVNFFDDDFKEKSLKVLDKNKPVYIYCRSGNRSGKACKILKKEGFDVINVAGGYNQWILEN